MANIIKPEQLEATVNKLLKEYGEDVRKAAGEAVKEVADEATNELHTAGSFRGTKYRASWTNEVKKTATSTDATVFNRKHYRLAHLLEFGHAKQNGGRTREFPHIAPINDKVPENFERKLRALLE